MVKPLKITSPRAIKQPRDQDTKQLIRSKNNGTTSQHHSQHHQNPLRKHQQLIINHSKANTNHNHNFTSKHSQPTPHVFTRRNFSPHRYKALESWGGSSQPILEQDLFLIWKMCWVRCLRVWVFGCCLRFFEVWVFVLLFWEGDPKPPSEWLALGAKGFSRKPRNGAPRK